MLAAVVFAALVSAGAASSPAPMGTASPPQGVSQDWWAGAQREIRNQEYHVTWQDSTRLADLPGAYHAANRAQNLRTYFTPDGFWAVPRDVARDVALPWEWGLKLVGWGRTGSMRAAEPVAQYVEANRIEYDRGDLLEWYVNDDRGLEQGFTVYNSPSPSQGEDRGEGDDCAPLHPDLAITGNVTAEVSPDGDAVDFFAPGGARVIHYAELHATDATGRSLPTWFEQQVRTADPTVWFEQQVRTAEMVRTADPTDEETLAAPISALRIHNSAFLSMVVDDAGAVYPITIDPLATTPSWTAESDQAGANFGWSVATAGDVNGDGYSDVIVGAPYYDNGQPEEGRAFVYHGSASGLSATPNWTAESDQPGANFGYSVATAGDVDGNGYSDVIVGAPYYDIGSHTDGGRAFVWYGSATGLGADGTPTNADWSTAVSHQALLGWSVATAGDVNGDDYNDVIVGGPNYDNGEEFEGWVFVYHGSAAGLSLTPAWTAESNKGNVRFGRSVATAGDVNGDGYDDVIVGAHLYSNGEDYEGQVFVYHGSAAGLSTAPNWTAESNQTRATLGWSVATAGDVNGDGYSDVIVGAPHYTNGEEYEGRVFVWLGSATGLGANGTPLNADWSAESDQALAVLGISVATAGDVNGDDYSDVIVGASRRAFVYHGSAAGLSAAADWTAESDQTGANFGSAVATAGDVNGDGYSDVIVGAYLYYHGQPTEGRAYVYYGAGVVCDDGNPCTDDAYVGGRCQYTNNAKSCNDNNGCTTNDRCSNGTCTGTQINCDDGNPCTTDGSCVNGVCQRTNNTNSCNDNNGCTTNDRCSNGTCTGTPINCDDGDENTSDVCTDNECRHNDFPPPLPVPPPCVANLDCGQGELCVGGECCMPRLCGSGCAPAMILLVTLCLGARGCRWVREKR